MRDPTSTPCPGILSAPMPTVAVICGSRSDLPTLKGCFDVLDEYGIGWEASVISAHRQAETLHAYVDEAERAGVQLFIGAAGLADAALVSLGGVGPDAAATFTRVGPPRPDEERDSD